MTDPAARSPSCTVSILAFRSIDSIEACVRSVLGQKYDGAIELRIREQGDDADEYALLERLAAEARAAGCPTMLERGQNLGFAGGHNRAIRASDGELFLPLNADAVLAEDYIAAAARAIGDGAVGAVQGKLLRWDRSTRGPVTGASGHPVIDTTGLLALRSRRFVNRGADEEDLGQYDDAGPPFAADGAAPVLVRRALDDVAVPLAAFAGTGAEGVEYFDESFFAYKEDVDLGWRLRLRGWSTVFTSAAVAWHGRGAPEVASSGLRALLDRVGTPSLAWRLGFSNQRLMQLKNDTAAELRPDVVPWLLREGAAWIGGLVTQPRWIWAVCRLVRRTPVARRKRSFIQEGRTVSVADWFV
ncbi:MAG: hypothetical protein QOE35_324 [Actinomycetota bacterium]|jgi:GT2 family glycosyltransferase